MVVKLVKAFRSWNSSFIACLATRQCHEVIQSHCLDDDTLTAQLLQVTAGDVSAVGSAARAWQSEHYF